MELIFKKRYEKLSDKEIVVLITDEKKHDEEAATYLLWDRYSPLLHKLFLDIIKDMEWYDYAVESLFVYLRGEDGSWHKLSAFEWRSSFGYWFKRTSFRHFLDVRKQLIEDGEITVSIDDEETEKPSIQLSDPDIERNRQKAMLMEAIAKLEDPDQRFVVLKRLQGYSSKEIAELMQQSWDKHGIVRMDKGKRVIPTPGYVDVRMQRAKEELRKLIVTID